MTDMQSYPVTARALDCGPTGYPTAMTLGQGGGEAVRRDVAERAAEALRGAMDGLTILHGETALLASILARLDQLVPAEAATVLLQQGSHLRVGATRGRVDARARKGHACRIVELPLYQEMQRLGRAVAAPEVLPEDGLGVRSARMSNCLLVPLAVRGRVLGALKLNGERKFESTDTALVQVFADYAALAIENGRLTHRLHVAQTRTRHLALTAVSAHERDRELLSRELHDDAGQALTALKIQLELLLRDHPEDSTTIEERLSEAVELAGETLEHIRILSHDLRPPAKLDARIGRALRKLCREFSKRTRLPIDYAGSDPPNLPDGAGICLFRVLQESLTNVAKHAEATRVHVRLRYNERGLRLTVEDNGRGFDVRSVLDDGGGSTGIGLHGMRERMECLGGTLQMHSEPDWGTVLIAELPTDDGEPL